MLTSQSPSFLLEEDIIVEDYRAFGKVLKFKRALEYAFYDRIVLFASQLVWHFIKLLFRGISICFSENSFQEDPYTMKKLSCLV